MTFNKPGRSQAQTERTQPVRVWIGCVATDKSYRWRIGRLLRPRRERPSRRTAEQRDELAPFH
jgi:hypothetical protein